MIILALLLFIILMMAFTLYRVDHPKIHPQNFRVEVRDGDRLGIYEAGDFDRLRWILEHAEPECAPEILGALLSSGSNFLVWPVDATDADTYTSSVPDGGDQQLKEPDDVPTVHAEEDRGVVQGVPGPGEEAVPLDDEQDALEDGPELQEVR